MTQVPHFGTGEHVAGYRCVSLLGYWIANLELRLALQRVRDVAVRVLDLLGGLESRLRRKPELLLLLRRSGLLLLAVHFGGGSNNFECAFQPYLLTRPCGSPARQDHSTLPCFEGRERSRRRGFSASATRTSATAS